MVETKSSLHTDDLRSAEAERIKCGKEHFDALATGSDAAKYVMATSVGDLLARLHAGVLSDG